VAVKASMGPRDGWEDQTISQGYPPLMAKTANIIPHDKNHRLARIDMVESTSAFITALSMLVTVSKSARPTMIKTMESKSIENALILLF